MSTANISITDIEQQARDYIAALPTEQGNWLTQQRNAAAQHISDLGLPLRKQEDWRYTSVDPLLKQQFHATPSQETAINPDQIRQHFLPDEIAARLVFVDGLFHAGLSSLHADGLQISSLRQAMQDGRNDLLGGIGQLSGQPQHVFSALNFATMYDGMLLHIAADTRLQRPIELLHISTAAAQGRSINSRHLIRMEKHARATLFERYVSLEADTAYFNNLVLEIELAETAGLKHERVQNESAQAYHLCDLFIRLHEQAHYHGVNAAVGAAWSRTFVHNRFNQPGANCELDGLYLAGDKQLVDFHLDIDHAVPGCASRENFKGILYGAGRAVFDGLIRVQEQAQKSDAHLSNNNLILSRQAEIDTKPQLEILADDVKCSHGTTVGQLDAQAMFYLRSRGLNEQQARQLLSVGFAVDVLEQLDSDSLREQLTDLINARVSGKTA
ncbi:MAG: Fe-S cluster assembly protein SufD [Chromatiales bacterium]|jgi:Fe-S cluster assembly protein SufD